MSKKSFLSNFIYIKTSHLWRDQSWERSFLKKFCSCLGISITKISISQSSIQIFFSLPLFTLTHTHTQKGKNKRKQENVYNRTKKKKGLYPYKPRVKSKGKEYYYTNQRHQGEYEKSNFFHQCCCYAAKDLCFPISFSFFSMLTN